MSTIKEQLKEYLAQEGLRPQEEDYGLYFRYQMLSFIIQWDENDAFFLSISLPSIFSVDENNRSDVLEVINQVNLKLKQIKCVLTDNDVWVTSDQRLDTTPKFEDIIPRNLDMLLGARSAFFDHLRQM